MVDTMTLTMRNKFLQEGHLYPEGFIIAKQGQVIAIDAYRRHYKRPNDHTKQ